MSEPAVLYTADDGVATLTMNRPQVLNALNGEMLDGLRDGLARAKADAAVRAVLLTGAGRGFCAGADLAAAAAHTGPFDVEQSLRERYHPIVLALRRCPKPVVAAVNGPAAGAGMSLALACDVVLAGESASFLQAFTRIGLVWQVFADERLLPEARACAQRLAQMPTRAYDLIKQALEQSAGNGLATQLEVEGRLQAQAMATEDHREGVAAFLAKRPAVFKGN